MVKEVLKNSSKKKYIILILIIAIIIVSITIICYLKYIFIESFTNKEYEILHKTLLSPVKKSLERFSIIENISQLDFKETKILLAEDKISLENKFIELKTTNETKIYDYERIMKCDNGSTVSINFLKDDIYSICNGTVKYTYNVKLFNVTGKEAYTNLMSLSLLISMSEYSLDLYEIVNDSSNRDVYKGMGQTLVELDYLAKVVINWQRFIEVYRNDSYNNDSLLNKDIEKYITNLEKFNIELKTPTEEEIKNIQLKDQCLAMMKDASSQNNLKKSLDSQKNFLFWKNIDKICSEFERVEIILAVKMLKRTENEKNPFVSISNKAYLDSFIKCNSQWIYQKPIGDDIYENKEITCFEQYKIDFVSNMIESLNK